MQIQKLQTLMTILKSFIYLFSMEKEILKLSTMQSLKWHLVNSVKIDVMNPQSPFHACAHELTGCGLSLYRVITTPGIDQQTKIFLLVSFKLI